MAKAVPETEPQEAREPIYTLDFDVVTSLGLDPESMVASRLCDAGKAAPVKGAKAKREKPSVKDIRKQIQQRCAKEPDYLEPDLPLQELAFRMLLASSTPVSLTDLHQRFSDLWVNAAPPRHIGREALGRVLAHDSYYGVVPVKQEEEKKP